jgi:hypothetical protein
MQVKLDYFRKDRPGKWYSEGELEVDETLPLYEIWEHIDWLREHRRLPSLIEGHSDYIVLVNVPGHRHEHPHLLGVRD